MGTSATRRRRIGRGRSADNRMTAAELKGGCVWVCACAGGGVRRVAVRWLLGDRAGEPVKAN